MKNFEAQALHSPVPAARYVPEPFRNDMYELVQRGVYDDEQIDVLSNQQRDFAYLTPQPDVDYSQYTPRVKKLGLSQYKAKLNVYFRRFRKIGPYLQHTETMLDIGAGDGLLLKIVKEQLPHIRVAACEKDRNTLAERQKVVGQNTFDELADLIRAGQTFSVVSLFHVLEHILDPAAFLHEIRQVLTPESLLIIEIPSLTCPLLSLYQSQAYRQFYFQRQHPFNYSHASLRRLMEYHQFQTLDVISFQRYSFENHLNWLLEGKPGGSEEFKALFERTDSQYISDLEQAQQTDSVIWIGKYGS